PTTSKIYSSEPSSDYCPPIFATRTDCPIWESLIRPLGERIPQLRHAQKASDLVGTVDQLASGASQSRSGSLLSSLFHGRDCPHSGALVDLFDRCASRE